MNRKISVAVGAAAAVAFTGAAYASDLLTINNTDGYVDPSVAASFVPYFLQPGGDCGASIGGTSTVGCPDHGGELVAQAAGVSLTNFWSGGDAVPQFPVDPETAFWGVVGHTDDNPFGSGIFRSDGTSYFSGMTWSAGYCDTETEADSATGSNCFGMGAPTLTGTFGFTRQQEWVDQVVVGYVESIRDSDGNQQGDPGGDITLAQNFRQQYNTVGTAATAQRYQLDQRLEQMVELDGKTGSNDTLGNGDASRQTLQQAFLKGRATTTNTFPATLGNPTQQGGGGGFTQNGQLISQDIQGFFMSCFNCDNGETPGHARTPEFLDVQYQPYVAGWDTVPTIVHGGQ